MSTSNHHRSWRDRWPFRIQQAQAYSPLPSSLGGPRPTSHKFARRSCNPRFWRRSPIRLCFYILSFLILFTSIFRPSYTHRPDHYQALERRISANEVLGRGNLHNEKIFITISLYDWGGKLASGEWAENVLRLIDLLGPQNTFLSIYENNSGKDGASALRVLMKRVKCENEILYEDVDLSQFPKVNMPDGQQLIKRILYLSEIRNRAFGPLNRHASPVYDKVLFLNDVFFDPVDAVQLLFSTNMQPNGKADYAVACALDFHDNPVLLYDVYATRDLEGHSMGVPFYPFFSHTGKAQSRDDMLAQKDAVRVKSCWSGMAAFDAKYIQPTSSATLNTNGTIGSFNIEPSAPKPITSPARFRAEPEIFFDACECCLLVADTIKLHKGTTDVGEDSGAYINPYIRVGYSSRVQWWTLFSRRFERLFSWPQWIANTVAHMPTYNPHRDVLEGERFHEEVWIAQPHAANGGHWTIKERTARNGMYCGVREMQVMLESKRAGKRYWENSQLPPGRQFF